jgi:hypothetical protein
MPPVLPSRQFCQPPLMMIAAFDFAALFSLRSLLPRCHATRGLMLTQRYATLSRCFRCRGHGCRAPARAALAARYARYAFMLPLSLPPFSPLLLLFHYAIADAAAAAATPMPFFCHALRQITPRRLRRLRLMRRRITLTPLAADAASADDACACRAFCAAYADADIRLSPAPPLRRALRQMTPDIAAAMLPPPYDAADQMRSHVPLPFRRDAATPRERHDIAPPVSHFRRAALLRCRRYVFAR